MLQTLVFCLLLACSTSALAGTVVVNSLTDATADDGVCNLREALLAAGLDTDAFGCVRAGALGDDVIEFDTGLWSDTFADLNISGQLNLIGDDVVDVQVPVGKILRITGAGTHPIIEINQSVGSEFHLSRVWIQEGYSATNGGGIRLNGGTRVLGFFDCSFLKNHADQDGGAIGLFSDDPLTIQIDGTTVFSQNSADDDGGAIGGVLSDWNSSGGNEFELIISGAASFTSNTADGDGGAIDIRTRSTSIDNGDHYVEIVGALFQSNMADGAGGAISIQTIGQALGSEIDVLLEDNVFDDNHALLTGGAVNLFQQAGTSNFNISGSFFGNRFEDNSSGTTGGALFMTGSPSSGDGPINLTANSFLGNQAGDAGGAVAFGYVNGAMINNLLANNTSGFTAGGLLVSSVSDALQNRTRYFIANSFYENIAGTATSDPVGWNIHYQGPAPQLGSSITLIANAFTAAAGRPPDDVDCFYGPQALITADYNVGNHFSCAFGEALQNNLSFPNAPLQAISHPVHTFASVPQPGSPLIDYWDDADCDNESGAPLTRDIIKFRRVAGVPLDGDGSPPADCDVGSFEVPTPPPVLDFKDGFEGP